MKRKNRAEGKRVSQEIKKENVKEGGRRKCKKIVERK
jgi:hypothetical protein